MSTADPTKQTGMTLLEVVVAMLIIGLGLAMSASMIQKSVRSAEKAQNHNIAQNLMQDITDRMRANSLAISCYTKKPDNQCKATQAGKFSKGAYARAKADKDAWTADIKNYWGETATGEITQDSGNTYTITIKWEEVSDQSRQAEAGKPDTDTNQQASMTFTL